MNKKGGHVDWVISAGIFLVYLIGLFILLRPGVTPVYKPEFLLENLENKFTKDTMWDVQEVPLFVEVCRPYDDGRKNCEITTSDKNNKYSFSRYTCSLQGNTGCKTWTGGAISTGHSFEIECANDESNNKPNLGEVTFTLTYYTDEEYQAPDLQVDLHNAHEDECKARLGASTVKSGISPGKLNDIMDKPYDDPANPTNSLKTLWGFPAEKEFAIFKGADAEHLGSTPIIGKFVNDVWVGPPQGVTNIFVKEIKTNMLSNTGELTPVLISIHIW